MKGLITLLLLTAVHAYGQTAPNIDQRIAALEAKVAAQAEEIEALKKALRSLAEGTAERSIAPPTPAIAPAPQSSLPLRIGGDVMKANCISCSPPPYPAKARAARVSDTVVMTVIVGKDGNVKDVTVIRGHELLRDETVEAVKGWKYKPQALNGEPVEVTATVSVSFEFR